jgi:hypothetical protein
MGRGAGEGLGRGEGKRRGEEGERGGGRGRVMHPHPPFQNPGSATERRWCT